MIYSLRVKNFRCLEDFAVDFSRENLLLGDNGSGKSTVFDAIEAIRAFVVDRKEAAEAFKASSCTRWLGERVQSFELVIGDVGERFRYGVVLEHQLDPSQIATRVLSESLAVCGENGHDRMVFESAVGSMAGLTGRLLGEGGRPPADLLASAFRSGVGGLDRGPATETLWRFKSLLADVAVVRLVPQGIGSHSEAPNASLSLSSKNFAAWFRHLEATRPDAVRRLEAALSSVWPSFVSISTVGSVGIDGEDRLCRTEWRSADGSTVEYFLSELSDGQRALLCFYAVLSSLHGKTATLCLDEPDNYVSLAELQPLLRAFEEQDGLQTLIVSHHPEVIDQWAVDHGLHFRRKAGGNCEVKAFAAAAGDVPLRASEIVALGWDDG